MPVSYRPLKRLRSKGFALRSYAEFDDHEFVIAVNDESVGLRGYIAIHNRNLGQAHGGTRLWPYKHESDAIKDVLNLSRAMSFKSASLGLPYGGAKGVIIWKDGLNKPAILKSYARKIEALNGIFRTGTDVGLTDTDVLSMSKYTKYVLGVHSNNQENLNTSKTAALGVYKAMKAAALYRYGDDNLQGKRIGLKGLGKLGSELAYLMIEAGANLIIADIDEDKLMSIKLTHPSVQIVEVSSMHKTPMDIFAPCAMGSEFTSSNIKELNCDIIVGGANNQLANLRVGDEIYKKGILYAPDFVANAGGLIFASEELEADGFNLERVMSRLDKIPKTLAQIFTSSEKEGIATHRIASKLAKERIQKKQK